MPFWQSATVCMSGRRTACRRTNMVLLHSTREWLNAAHTKITKPGITPYLGRLWPQHPGGRAGGCVWMPVPRVWRDTRKTYDIYGCDAARHNAALSSNHTGLNPGARQTVCPGKTQVLTAHNHGGKFYSWPLVHWWFMPSLYDVSCHQLHAVSTVSHLACFSCRSIQFGVPPPSQQVRWARAVWVLEPALPQAAPNIQT